MLSIKLISDGVLRSAGAMRAFMSTTFLDLFIRVALSYILAPVIGFTGVCISWPAGWIVSSILSYFYYKKGFSEKAKPFLNIV
jgi:Na+-driven multidrug efflux pump